MTGAFGKSVRYCQKLCMKRGADKVVVIMLAEVAEEGGGIDAMKKKGRFTDKL